MTRRISIPVVIAICLILAFAGGFAYGKKFAPAPTIQKLVNQDAGKVQNVDFSLFWKVWNDLSAKYVDKSKLDAQGMIYGAIQGMVGALGDPYTVFLEPETSKKFQEEIAGSFGGVGMEIGVKNNVLTVIAPLPDTPAARAGLIAGDKITKINGRSTAGMSSEEGVSQIRGKVGTKVTVTISSNGSEPRDITITRATIKIPTVVWKMLDSENTKVAHVQIYQFNQNVDSAFEKAAREILKSDAKALIIDLRNNPGGLLDSAINLAGYFIDKDQLVVSEVFGNGSKNDFRTDGDAALKKYPTIFLVNGGSASASEILAGAVHDNRKVRLLGEKTFGKGSVQELVEFDRGASLKVTVARWFTPAGINISEKGIEPDIKVELTEEQKKELIFGDQAKDPQLQKALDLLR